MAHAFNAVGLSSTSTSSPARASDEEVDDVPEAAAVKETTQQTHEVNDDEDQNSSVDSICQFVKRPTEVYHNSFDRRRIAAATRRSMILRGLISASDSDGDSDATPEQESDDDASSSDEGTITSDEDSDARPIPALEAPAFVMTCALQQSEEGSSAMPITID